MKRIISVLLTICIIFSLCTISVISSNAEVTTEYKDEFAKFALGDTYKEFKDYIFYEEYYRCFSEDNITETPDWIFGMGYIPVLSPLNYWTNLGDYVIFNSAYFQPFTCGYFVYVPTENKFYDLEQVWDSGFKNLDLALAKCIDDKIYGLYILGDTDLDNELTVMDATNIQFEKAGMNGLEKVSDMSFIADYDGDKTVDIMDATAIQRHIAGLE